MTAPTDMDRALAVKILDRLNLAPSRSQKIEILAEVVHGTPLLAAERERCAAIAENPYSDAVEAYGNDEPFTVGQKIASAIRFLS